MLKYCFEGRSHGEGYRGEIEGLPQGFLVDVDMIDAELARRKNGVGRSARQSEVDKVVLKGLDGGKTTEKIEFFVANDKNVQGNLPPVTALRAGHVDVVAANVYGADKVREVNERASARNSLCYVVLGAICKQLLATKGVSFSSKVTKIGGIALCDDETSLLAAEYAVERAMEKGDSLGGEVQVRASGVPMGLGNVFPYSEKMDGKIAGAMAAIPSVKAVEFGIGRQYADLRGTEAADKLQVSGGKVVYATNKCGGVVGGMTTGQDVLLTLAVKPVPTVRGAKTIDVKTLAEVEAHYERADTCVVENVGVIAENMLAIVIFEEMQKSGKL